MESQCKIAHYDLNSHALELKDAQSQLVDAIEEMERFKIDIVAQLKNTLHKQSLVTLDLILGVFNDMQVTETTSLAKFSELLKTMKVPASPSE